MAGHFPIVIIGTGNALQFEKPEVDKKIFGGKRFKSFIRERRGRKHTSSRKPRGEGKAE